MSFLRGTFITLFCCLAIANSETENTSVAENEDSLPQIASVLGYLNSNSNGVYGYKRGSLVAAQKKADIIEVTVEVDVDCLRNYPEIPCNEQVFICHAFIRQNRDQTYDVLSDVKCIPNVEITVEDVDEVKTVVPMVFGEQSLYMEKIDLSSEALSPMQGGADFVAIPKDNIPCLGCPFDLNTDAEGVDELIHTAVKHIETEKNKRHKIINVRRLQQQVVAGLKYILLAEVAQTTCPKDADLTEPCILDMSVEPFVCEITFIEKPWISKSKHIIKNNCTVSQEFEPIDLSKRDQDDMNNEILPEGGFFNPAPQEKHKPIPNYNVMAQTGNMEDDMDADRLADLESQILFGDMIEVPKQSKVNQNPKSRMPSTFVDPEYVSVDEPTPIITDTDDHLTVEPLNIEDSHLYRIPLFSSVPVIDESDPIVRQYNYQNEEPLKTSDENIVTQDTDHFFEPAEFENYFPVQQRVTRKLSGDSDSDSTSEESKETEKATKKNDTEINEIDIVAAKIKQDDTSEESSESQDTVEKRQRVRRDTGESKSDESDSTNEKGAKQRPKRAENNNNDSSSSSSSSSSDDDDTNDNNNTKDHNNKRTEKAQKLKEPDDNNNDSSSSSSSSDEDDKPRPRRSIGQMEKITPDEKVIVRDLADFAAVTLDNIDDDHQKRVILQILGAKKLKLDGIYYQIILRLGISHCHEHEHNENCREKLFTNLTKICKVQVHVDDDYSNPKVVKSQCQNIKKDENDRNRTNYSRYRRSILAGGHTPRSTDDPDVQKFVRESLTRLDSSSNHPNKHKAVKIISATSQVVAGARYVITAQIGLSDCSKSEKKLPETCDLLENSEPETCTIDVWDRPWLKKTIYRIKCNDIVQTFGDEEENTRRKRAIGFGAPSEVPKDSDEIIKLLEKSLLYLDSKSEHENKYIVDEVLSASSQVVAGSLTKIEARIAVSDCKKGSELKNCTKLNDTQGSSTVCKFKIVEQSWLNFTQTNVTCDDNQSHSFTKKRNTGDEAGNIRRKRAAGLVGAPSEVNKDSDEIINLLEKSLLYLDSKSEHENKYIVDEVLSASQQLVAGLLTRIEASIAVSDCKKGSDLKNCTKLNDQGSSTVCKFKIWEQSWLNFTQTNVTCDDNQSHSFRRKRNIGGWNGPQLLGADEDVSSEDLKAKNFITMALEYITLKSNPQSKYELRRINKVTRRIVAGSLWNIEADIALCNQTELLRTTYSQCPDSNQDINCHFTVLHQPWRADSALTINIKCNNDNQVYTYMPVQGYYGDSMSSFDYEGAFTQFGRKYNKVYRDEEYAYRLKVFRDNLNKIALLNKFEKGTAQYGITPFADLTEKEFSQSHGYKSKMQHENELPFAPADIPHIEIPQEFDWRTKNAVTKVKNQGLCGSCWAFSVTGNVEGQYAIQHGKLLEFSEQELVDCDKVDQGCNGGLMDNAYRVIEKLGGLESEADYPYEGADEKCNFNPNKVKVELTGALNISHNETDMAKWLVKNGPISIAINANAMQFYIGGVSHPWKMLCSPKNLDHGVLIVGYGVHKYALFNKTLPYWIVKNSWGPSWGEQGYYRVYRGDGTCGLNQTPSSAIVA